MQTSFDLPRRWSVDALLRHVSELPFGPVPAYTTTDVHLAWQMTPRLELALVGQDLNQPRHVEWLGDADVAVAIRRSGYLKMTWRP
jgi:iron complex outermembrane receptor protein